MTRTSIRKGRFPRDGDASFIVTPRTFDDTASKPELAIVGGPRPYIAIHAEGHDLISVDGANAMRQFAKAILQTLKKG